MIWTEQRKELARAEMERWRSVPHKDRIAVPGVGIDCVHLVQEIYVAAGIIPRVKLGAYDITEGMLWQSDKVQNALTGCLTCELIQPAPRDPEFGDIANFKTGNSAGHIGVYADGFLWQSLAGRCVTPGKWELWRHRVRNIIRVTGEGFKASPLVASKL